VAQSQYHDIGIARKLGYQVCWIERRQGMEGFGGTPEVPALTKPDFHFATMKAFADAAVDAERNKGPSWHRSGLHCHRLNLALDEHGRAVARSFPSLSDEVQADVVIIGAGYTGASAAHHIAKSGLTPVVIEANRPRLGRERPQWRLHHRKISAILRGIDAAHGRTMARRM